MKSSGKNTRFGVFAYRVMSTHGFIAGGKISIQFSTSVLRWMIRGEKLLIPAGAYLPKYTASHSR